MATTKTLDQLTGVLLDYMNSISKVQTVNVIAPKPSNAQIEGTLNKLTDAILDYSTAETQPQDIGQTQKQTVKSDMPKYCGQAFQFHLGQYNGAKVTAVMADIETIWERVFRYTSQKSRFIASKEGATNTDLYAFSPDEKDLYTQFLIEAADRISKLFLPYTKKLPFKGYLFNEGVNISSTTENDVQLVPWPESSFVKIGDQLYQSVQDVPAGIAITDENYWQKVSALYDTKGKVAYFLDADIPENAVLNCLQAVENYLYAFVLWRWYTMAGIGGEVDTWSASFSASERDINSVIITRTTPIRRPVSPW